MEGEIGCYDEGEAIKEEYVQRQSIAIAVTKKATWSVKSCCVSIETHSTGLEYVSPKPKHFSPIEFDGLHFHRR